MDVKITFEAAEDASEVADFHCSAFGGTAEAAVRDVTRRMGQGTVLVARRRGRIVAALCLTPRKPWAIDASYFTKVRVPLYLLDMIVAPGLPRQGIGRLFLLEAEKFAAGWPAQAIRLDAYDSQTGAGGFYQRCGYREVGRAVYRQTPLIYYELLIEPVETDSTGRTTNAAVPGGSAGLPLRQNEADRV
jgi:GNAT superfamily N-acetyltransferase